MKKLLLPFISLLLLGLFFACEENDICLEGKTPQLIIKLKNKADPKQIMDSLYIFQENTKGFYTPIIAGKGRDSVSIPLPLEETNHTNFIFSKRKDYTAENSDKAILSYDYSTKYTSKACGFRVIYKNLKFDLLSTHFIKSYKILRNEITDQSSAHIELYY